jgi:hypothetical protein
MTEAYAMVLAGIRRESAGMAERARRFLELCAEHDLSLFLPGAQVFGGWILACEEDPVEGIACFARDCAATRWKAEPRISSRST